MMNATAQLYFKTAIVLLVIGMVAGIAMAASGNHAIAPAHAHLNLLGFVVTAVYGVYFGLNEAKASGRLPKLILGIHAAAVVVMFPSLAYLLLGNESLEIIVSLSSIAVLAAAVMFGYVVWKPVETVGMVKTARA